MAHSSLIFTPVENIDTWEPQKDKTGVLLGVLNNAHHKCCTFDLTLNDIDSMMRSAPLEFSLTPPKWCSIVDLEISKKAERINMDKMRLIQVMHPPYQINNKNVHRGNARSAGSEI